MSERRLAELKARWLPIYLVLMIALILIAAHLAIMYITTGDTAYANLAVISGVGIYLVYSGLNRLRKLKITRIRLVEVLSCYACGYSEQRVPEAGDYVFKTKGECPKCGSRLVVSAIYSIKERA